MSKGNIKFFQATAVMIGYTIGVGIFGLPYLVSKAGLLPFLILFAILLPVQYIIHLIYGSIILSTEGYHRMPGYTEIYLGKGWKMLVFVGKVVGSIGAMLAYIIVTGIFLNDLLQPIFGGIDNTFLYATIFFALEAFIVYLGVGMIAKTELVLTALLIGVVVLISIKGAPFISSENYIIFDWKYMLLPYGALLFSLDGNGSLPVVARLLRRNPEAMKKVVRLGTFVSAAITLLFTLSISGITGASTTPDALTGVSLIMNGAVTLALVFGIISMATSFFGVAEAVRDTLNWDYGLNKKLSWAIAVFVPYGLYVLGVENLTDVITFVGALGGGLCALVLVRIYMKIRKQKKTFALISEKLPTFLHWFLLALFTLGMLYTIWEYFIN